MILLLVPVVCAVVGLILYAALRLTDAFGLYAGTGGSGTAATSSGHSYAPKSSPSTLRERITEIPSGWLIAVIALAGIWILGWIVVLGVGLNLLT